MLAARRAPVEQVGAVRRGEEGGDRLGPRQQADEVVIRAGGEHGGQHVVPLALGAELDAEAVGDEFEQRLASAPRPADRSPASWNSLQQRQPQPVLADDADHAERGAAQRVRVAGAGRHLADGEEGGELVDLVGQGDGDA